MSHYRTTIELNSRLLNEVREVGRQIDDDADVRSDVPEEIIQHLIMVYYDVSGIEFEIDDINGNPMRIDE